MGKKRTISSKSIGSRGAKGFLISNKMKVLLAVFVILVVASFIPAVTNQVNSISTGMNISTLEKQIEEQKAERRRLVALKAEAMSPEQISRAATRLGFIPMSARNIKGYESSDDSTLPKADRAEVGENPAVKTISSGVLGTQANSPELVLISDRSQKRQR